jgi:uncharacterized protein YjdB
MPHLFYVVNMPNYVIQEGGTMSILKKCGKLLTLLLAFNLIVTSSPIYTIDAENGDGTDTPTAETTAEPEATATATAEATATPTATAEATAEATAVPTAEAAAEATPTAEATATAETTATPTADTTETVAYPAFSASVIVNGVTVALSADEGVIPEGTTMSAEDISSKMEDKMSSEYSDVLLFDIALYDAAGKKLDDSWSKSGKVTVTLTGTKVEELSKDSDTVSAVNVDDSGNVQETKDITASTDNSVSFDVEHFSAYGLAVRSTAAQSSNSTAKVVNVTLTPTAMSLTSGESGQLTAAVETDPADSSDEFSKTWTSADNSIATVDENGTVTATSTAASAKTTTVSVKVGDITRTATITVNPIAISSISIDYTGSNLLKAGSTAQLSATVEPLNQQVGYYWSSSDESVATVNSDGKVTGVSAGTATISVRSKDGKNYCFIYIYCIFV